MPDAGYLIEYHVVTRGTCWAGLTDGEPVQLRPATSSSFRKATRTCCRASPACALRPTWPLRGRRQDAAALPAAVRRQGPDEAGVVCGFLGCDARPFNPLLTALPRFMHLPATSPHRSAWLNHIVQAAVDESVNKRSGGESVLGRLSELMFIEVVRSYIRTLSAEETGWLAGLADRHVAAALNAMHGKPVACMDAGRAGEDGRPLALRLRRALHAGARAAADPVSHRMAHAACDRAAGQQQGQHRAGRSPGRLRIRSRLQPRLQEAGRNAAGGMAAHAGDAEERDEAVYRMAPTGSSVRTGAAGGCRARPRNPALPAPTSCRRTPAPSRPRSTSRISTNEPSRKPLEFSVGARRIICSTEIADPGLRS